MPGVPEARRGRATCLGASASGQHATVPRATTRLAEEAGAPSHLVAPAHLQRAANVAENLLGKPSQVIAMFEVLKHLIDDVPADPQSAAWAAVRRAPRGCDHALTGTTRVWLRRLPARRRPLRLCEAYPRVANRIAWCWRDADLSEQVLDDLLVDRRGGRRGFPAPIVRELQRLREFNAQQRVEMRPEAFTERLGRVMGLGD